MNLEMFEISIAIFEIKNKIEKFSFFKKIILLANLNLNII